MNRSAQRDVVLHFWESLAEGGTEWQYLNQLDANLANLIPIIS